MDFAVVKLTFPVTTLILLFQELPQTEDDITAIYNLTRVFCVHGYCIAMCGPFHVHPVVFG